MSASANAKANAKAEKRNRAKSQKKSGSPEKLLKSFTQDAQFVNDMTRWAVNLKKFVLFVFQLILIVGVCYVIIGPVLGIISSSFFSNSDYYNPMVYLIPQEPTLERYKMAFQYLNYSTTVRNSLIYSLSLMAIQVFVCSMVGYGFARFDFPLKKILFGCVVVMIVIPTNTIMLPLYMTFAKFDVFGIIKAVTGSAVNLLSTPIPMYIMTAFGCGLRSGLYIYIFNQFFRGLPKEIEEAALVDGCGIWYTYFRIMLINALPSVVTVAIFSMVWQYNDTFYAKLFLISDNIVISKKISTIEASISNVEKIYDPSILELYLDAGIVLVMIPIILIYVLLQKQFIEGVERSGIVG
ncbi:MAG: carbohydrate ABC transporter permease [Lachnospiraceae bacterium]|nr:carbohydrate ABC transporter permease [Lachnospiraceae bacterium]